MRVHFLKQPGTSSGTRRFNELRRLMPEVTQRMLTLQLREMEVDQLIQRKVYREVPPKVEYSLAPLGQTLVPLITAMREWGAAHEATVIEYRRAAHAEARASVDSEEMV